MNPSQLAILLVEDDENDVFFTCRAMAKASLRHPIHVAANGQDALDYLSGAGNYSDRAAYPVPQCLFLDLKLPFVHGFQVLEWMRGQSALKEIPVIVLTSSPEQRDQERAQQLGAAAYLVKPATAQMFSEAVAAFCLKPT